MNEKYRQRIERKLSLSRTPEGYERFERRQKAQATFMNMPIADWPNFAVKWDLSEESQRYAFDGCDEVSFKEEYPEGLVVLHCSMKSLDLHLCFHSRQSVGEFWSIGLPENKCVVIQDWVDGFALTPCFIDENTPDGLLVAGGNARLAVARAKGEKVVPILVRPRELDEISSLLRGQ